MISTVPDRLSAERDFHDLQARQRSARFADPAELIVADEFYLNHEPWIRPAVDALGDLRGRRVLDLGCGHGMASVVFARRGALVCGLDLSAEYVEEARRRAMANRVDARFCVGDAESTPYRDGQFDAVWGCAVVHHLDVARFSAELRRIVRPGGTAVFCEPWGGNPLFEFARRRLPYAGKHRTRDEHPLLPHDLERLRREFPTLRFKGYQLVGSARRIFRRESPSGGFLDRLDAFLFRSAPRLQRWARYAVLSLKVE